VIARPDIPGAYATGRVRFMGLDLLVAPGALVPRPETETLASTAIEVLRSLGTPKPRVIDMCCGAGNLACAIAHHVPQARVWATDLTLPCVELASRNTAHCGFEERLTVLHGDLFAPLMGPQLENTIDVIVCNPPYISEGRLATECTHLLEHEPRAAFAAGQYGLSVHLRMIREGAPFLRPDGVLLMEVGVGQAQQVKRLFERARIYADIGIVNDDNGDERVVHARKAAQA
jgi:release factor glutamine methyltransferase